jgi:hypothetical protein
MDELKKRIHLSMIPRKILAQRLQMQYSTFASKINGFSRFSMEEERALEKILSEAEAAREAENESTTPYFVK